MAKTFNEYRSDHLKNLAEAGWTVVTRDTRTGKELKVPYATSPSGGTRLWFKTQAVYFTEGNSHNLKGARSLTDDMRILTDELVGLL